MHEARNTSTYQISARSVNARLTYIDDSANFPGVVWAPNEKVVHRDEWRPNYITNLGRT